MRKLVFEPYAKQEDGAKLPMVVRVWSMLSQATQNRNWKSGEDALKERASARLLDKLDVLTVDEKNEQGKVIGTRLRYEGGEVLLEDAEFARLEDAWKALRPDVPDAFAREKVAVLEFLNKAPTVETAEVAK